MTYASIMMATYNRFNLTKQMLNNLLEVTDYPFELIIIDNASTDDTKFQMTDILNAAIDAKHPFLRSYSCHWNDKNVGIAKARNQALRAAAGEWLSTVDNDVLLPQGWLAQCIAILQANRSYGMVGVNFERESFPLVKQGDLEWQHKARGNLGTACTVFNRSLHKLLGYFNTEYGLYGEEDADFGMRVRVAGMKLGYLKENGRHLGEGAEDVGPYREFKTKAHADNLQKFNQNCARYMNHQKSLYIPYHD